MIKKRLIGVVTVRNGIAVQSFGYRRWLPLGRPEVLVENLDRWGADEILLQCTDRGVQGPDYALLDRVSRLGLSTPLIYAGGVSTAEHAVRVVKTGADRVCIDSLLHDNPDAVTALAEPLGAQALVASMPMSMENRQLCWLDFRKGSLKPLAPAVIDILQRKVISEVMVIDWRHEGYPTAFDETLLRSFSLAGVPRIAFGGISTPEQIRSLLSMPDVVAVAIGNFLNYREHAIQLLKTALGGSTLRTAHYRAGSTD